MLAKEPWQVKRRPNAHARYAEGFMVFPFNDDISPEQG
jgi:hypothetical protein